eukprot:scaffold31898_cov60-Phaeocystis_antarctica.AAC.3
MPNEAEDASVWRTRPKTVLLIRSAGAATAACAQSIVPWLARANRSTAPVPMSAPGTAAIAACPPPTTALLAFVKELSKPPTPAIDSELEKAIPFFWSGAPCAPFPLPPVATWLVGELRSLFARRGLRCLPSGLPGGGATPETPLQAACMRLPRPPAPACIPHSNARL